jgi:hypothetical protein
MTRETHIIDITPDQSLMPKLGQSGYSVPQAIAELVDNAIDARMDGEGLRISLKIGKNEVSVADNGQGMDREEVQAAMVLGRSSKKDQLGEFGLGLKTSCTSLGTAFSVTTSKAGVPFEYVIEYDENEWVQSDDLWKIKLEVAAREAEHHYTVIKVIGLRRYYPGMADNITRDLQRRFAPFIANGDVEITVNKKPCRPETHDLLEDSRQEFEIEDRLGHRVRGWYGLLKQGSNKGYYGFHTYRRGRMITTYDKIAIGEHPTISRIIGEIHLDEVPVTHNKREFIKTSEEYAAAVETLKAEFQELLRRARQKASSDMLNRSVKNEMERWKDSLARAVQAGELKPYTAQVTTPSEAKRDPEGEELLLVDVEQRQSPESSSEPAMDEASPRERLPRMTHKKLRHAVKVKGKTVDFRHEFAPLGAKASWKNWSYDVASGLDVYTNQDFPAYFVTKDKAFYAAIHIAESIAELFVQEAGASAEEMDDIKQLILRKAAAVKDQWIEEEPEAVGPDCG